MFKKEQVEYRTRLVDTVYESMNLFVKSVEGQLDSERLHDVFRVLAVELRKLIGMLAARSLEDAKKTEIAGFVRM